LLSILLVVTYFCFIDSDCKRKRNECSHCLRSQEHLQCKNHGSKCAFNIVCQCQGSCLTVDQQALQMLVARPSLSFKRTFLLACSRISGIDFVIMYLPSFKDEDHVQIQPKHKGVIEYVASWNECRLFFNVTQDCTATGDCYLCKLD